MVSGLSIAAMFFSMIVPLTFFIVFLIVFMVKKKPGFIPVLVGAGAFLVFALIIEGFINRYILVINGSTVAFFKNALFVSIYGGLMAGIFEETGRLVGFKLFFKNRNEWKHGVAYGIGHGGLEIIYIGGILALTQINNVIYSMMINGGTFDSFLKKLAGMPEQVTALATARQQLISLPSYFFLAGGIERVSTLLIHIALSLLVFYAVKKRRYVFFALSILLHALLDFLAAYLSQIGVNTMIIEGIIVLFAVVSVVFILKSRKLFASGEKVNEAISN
jgi:uncharacterized membrane protein YhfC